MESLPSKNKIYQMLADATVRGDNVAVLEAQRLLNVALLKECDGEPIEQARISSELLRLTKELLNITGRGDDEDLLDSAVGRFSLGDAE